MKNYTENPISEQLREEIKELSEYLPECGERMKNAINIEIEFQVNQSLCTYINNGNQISNNQLKQIVEILRKKE